MDEEIRIEYIPLSKAVEWDWEENPKAHDIGGMVESIWRYGFQDPPKYDAALDRFVYGNGRVQAVAWGKKEGRKPPRGVKNENGEWMIPVKFGVDIETVSEARAFAIDHNNQTLMGGDLTTWDVAQIWDGEGYLALLSELATEDVLPVSVDGDDLDGLSIMLRDEWLPNDLESLDIEGAGDESLRVIIQFQNQSERSEFFESIDAEVNEGKVRYNWADIKP